MVRLGFISTLAPDALVTEETQVSSTAAFMVLQCFVITSCKLLQQVFLLLQTNGENEVVSRSFTEIAAAFLDKTSKKTSAQNSPARRSTQPMWASSTAGKPSVEPRAGRVGVYCHLNHMQRELVRPFKVLPATVKRNQLHFGQSVSEWYNALPRAAKGSRGQLKEQVSSCHQSLELWWFL